MTFWPSAIIGFVVATILAIGIHELIVDSMERQQTAAIEAQKTADLTTDTKYTQPAIASDSDALQSCNTNLDACNNLLQHAPTTCVPITHVAECTKTAQSAASRPSFGLTAAAIEAHNLTCRNQIGQLNNAKDWATACIKNGTCQ